jgi:Amidohydrolase
MKIDAFCHIMPAPYYDRFIDLDASVHAANLRKRVSNIPSLVDMSVRFGELGAIGAQIYTHVHGAAMDDAAFEPFYAEVANHVLFGSDSPYDPERGPGYIRSTIKNLNEIGLSDAEKEAIFHGNVERLFGLTVLA